MNLVSPWQMRRFTAQIGWKRGARISLSMLPKTSDLPGNRWIRLGQNTTRMGWMNRESELGARARELHKVSATRYFKQLNRVRWLWAQVLPFANEADAATAMSNGPTFVRNPRSKGYTVTKEGPVGGVTVPGCLSSWAHERESSGRIGEAAARMVMATKGPVLFVVSASGLVNKWSWDEVVSVADGVAKRISQSLDVDI